MTTRLLVIDDHPVVVGGLTAALGPQPDVEVVGTASTKEEARRLIEALNPDIALLDVRLPDGLGLDLITPRSAGVHGPRWLVLSSFDTPQYFDVARARGASGYLLKTAPIDALMEAIRTIAAGGSTFASTEPRGIAAADGGGLSQRQASIVALLLRGESNAEVAGHLGIALKTVESSLTRLYDRFGVVSRTELALRAEREGWIASADQAEVPAPVLVPVSTKPRSAERDRVRADRVRVGTKES